MSGALKILRSGPLNTVQDIGRFGHQRFGVTPAGPMDRISFHIAAALVGNAPSDPQIEIGTGGLELEAAGHAVLIGFAGPHVHAVLDSQPLAETQSLVLEPGQRLFISPAAPAGWAYLAVAGGFEAPCPLGSYASHTRSGLGGGTALAGSQLHFTHVASSTAKTYLLAENAWPARPARLRLLPGPQAEMFTDEAWTALTTSTYTLSPRSDRMGYRLDGPALTRAAEGEMVSDGIVTGAIQVPHDGAPIVLMADRQTTGGYPKIAVLATADLPFAAQTLPGAEIKFTEATAEDAISALKAQQQFIAQIPSKLVAKSTTEALTPEALLAHNLVGGVISATEK